MMSGLRSSSRSMPRRPCRAIGQTAPAFSSGTHTPITTAISTSPAAPSSRSASASAMKELNRNATCAPAACSRRSIWRPIQGSRGRLYAIPMPIVHIARAAPISRDAAYRSSGLFTIEWNSSTGNSR